MARRLVRFEQELLTKRCDLLLERLASDALVESFRHCRRGMSSKSTLRDGQATSMLSCQDQSSFGVVLDRTDLSLDGLNGSLNAAIGVAVSDWTFLHDLCWNMGTSFVFDVNDARFLIALQALFSA